MNYMVLCDFDGTMVDIDTCVYILERFAKADWRLLDKQFERGEITLEECLRRQFSTVVASEVQILRETRKAASIRPGFAELVECCRARELPLTIVSAGLDFVINHFLRLGNWSGFVEVHSPKSECTADGIMLAFPRLIYRTSISFKDDIVRYCKEQGRRTVYIGDGVADYYAAKYADFPFAIKGSRLDKMLCENNLHHRRIVDFREVIRTIQSNC